MKSDKNSFLIMATIAIIVILCAVAMSRQEEQANKTHGYDDLPTEMKAEVDFLLSKSGEWGKYESNTKTIQCTEVSIPRSDGDKVLYAFYFDGRGWDANSYNGWRVWYSYDPAAGAFYKKDWQYANYAFYDVGKSSSHTYTAEWSNHWDTATKRDYLANQLWLARNSD